MKRITAVNEGGDKGFDKGGEREATCGLACNEITIDGDWMQICRWGDFPNEVGLQRVTRADGQRMVTAFNSTRGKLARAFMGLPIFVGHPDVKPEKFPDRRRYGKIVDLDARADGFFGKVVLNDLGRQAIEQGHYLYNSPAWYLEREKNLVRPVELISVGLTNSPQIPGEPWAKNENERTDMIKWLADILAAAGLMKADGTEEQAKTAVNELVKLPARVADLDGKLQTATNEKTALAGERDTLKGANTTLTTERDGLRRDLAAANERCTVERKARIDRELDIAVNTGRIAQAERAAWNDKLAAGFEAGATELHARTPAISTNSKVGGLGSRKNESAAGSEKIAAINEAVRNYGAKNNVDVTTNAGYNAAFAAVRRTQPALFQ